MIQIPGPDTWPELQERLKNAKTPEDILALVKEEGFELSEDQLDSVSGGGGWDCDELVDMTVPH